MKIILKIKIILFFLILSQAQAYDLDYDGLSDKIKLDNQNYKAIVNFGNKKKKVFDYPEIFVGVKPELVHLTSNQIDLFYSFPDRGTAYILVSILYKNNNFKISKIEKYINMFPDTNAKMCIEKMAINVSDFEDS